jgi:hypothetical protein
VRAPQDNEAGGEIAQFPAKREAPDAPARKKEADR